MKRFFTRFLVLKFILFLSFPSLSAQISEAENNRLFYLCKVWGYYKYFHPSLTDCNKPDWDLVLIQSIEETLNVTNDPSFNIVLERLENFVAPIPPAQSPPPDLSNRDAEKLDLTWLEADIFSGNVRNNLRKIQENFRPSEHCGVATNGGGTFMFPGEKPYSSMIYPQEVYRLLALFRFWNVIEYYYPFTDQLDKDWDETLKAFLPRMREVKDEKAYQLEMLALFSEMEDAYLTVLSPTFETYIGFFYAPFEITYVDNKTLIKSVLHPDLELQAGDEITHIDGYDIETLRDSMRAYSWGGDREWRINDWIVRGQEGAFEMTIQNGEGSRVLALTRTLDAGSYEKILPVEGKLAQRLPGNYGYVSASRVDANRIQQTLFNLERQDPVPSTIILDLRKTGLVYHRNFAQHYMRGSKVFALKNHIDPWFPAVSPLPSEQKVGLPKTDTTQLLILLIDESTVGGGELTTMSLEAHSQVIKVGSPTAGSVGEDRSFLWLPGGISILFNTQKITYPDGRIPHRIGIQPDVLIRPNEEDIRIGRDAVLDAAILEAKSNIEKVSVLVFPNPTADRLDLLLTPISNNTVQIDILDMTGRVIRHFEYKNDQAIIRLDISDLQQGHYTLRTIDGENISTSKFMKI